MEAGLLKDEIGFDNRSIRAGFIRKVFSIVAMQLLLVTGMCAFAIFHEGTNKFVRANEGLYWAG
jgi:FtsH-binding integral membrane protein